MFSATLGCTNAEAQTRAVYACVSVQISVKVAPTKDGRTWFQKSETSSKTAVDVTTRQNKGATTQEEEEKKKNEEEEEEEPREPNDRAFI